MYLYVYVLLIYSAQYEYIELLSRQYKKVALLRKEYYPYID